MPFTGDTKILTVYDGPQELGLLDQDTLIYCWNPETKLANVRIMRNVRKILEDSAVLAVEFDSGLTVTCLPYHSFYTYRGNLIEVMDLSINQAIRAFSLSDHRGHLRVHGWVDNRVRHQYVARLVWEAFNGEIPEGMILHHKDMNKQNNRLENFQLVTNSEHSSIHYDGRVFTRNHKIVSIDFIDEGFDLYTFDVDEFNNCVIADDVPVSGLYSGIISAT